MSVHDGVQYQCNQCDYKAGWQGDLKMHRMSDHECVKYQCILCDSKFSSQGNLKKHKMSIHEGVIFIYQCH